MTREILTSVSYLAYGLVSVSALFLVRRYGAGRLVEGATRWQLILAGLFLALTTFAVSEPWHALFEDFTDAYYQGARDLVRRAAQLQEVASSDVHGFVNIPIIAAIFLPFAILPVWLATTLFTGLGIAAVFGTYLLLVKEAQLDRNGKALLAIAFLLNGPLFNSIREGNTTHFALFAVVTAFVKLREGRKWVAGIILGLIAFLKLPLLLYGVYFVLRRNTRSALAMGLTVASIGGLSFAFLGIEPHIEWYLQFVTGAGSTPVLAFNVQSILPLLVRLEQETALLCSWDGVPAGDATRLAGIGIVLSLYAAAISSTLQFRGSSAPPSGPLIQSREKVEFLMVLVLACVTTPLAWSHYFAWMLMPLAFLLSKDVNRDDSRASQHGLLLATVLVSLPVVWPFLCQPPTWFAAPYLILTSHYLIGGVFFLFLLIQWRWRLRHPLP